MSRALRVAFVPSLLLLGGCLDELLESPYVLTPGLGEVRAVAPGLHGELLVASATGLYAIDGNGVATRTGEAADGVTVHPGVVYVRRGGTVSYDGGAIDVTGAVDILAGYDALAGLYPDRLVLDGRFGHTGPPMPDRVVSLGRTDARAVALGPTGYLVTTATALLAVDADVRVLADGLTDARAAATDTRGRVYVAHGAPTELWRVEPTGLVSMARWLGDTRDLQFGLGGLLPAENVYIANGAGSVDYVRPM